MFNAPFASEMQRIFVVEDSPMIRESLVDFLNDSDQRQVIGTAETEDEAYRLIAESPTDAAIIDVNLREGSGIGLLARLQHLDHSPKLRIVYTSHYNRPLHERCSQLGATHVLCKGGDFSELLDALGEGPAH